MFGAAREISVVQLHTRVCSGHINPQLILDRIGVYQGIFTQEKGGFIDALTALICGYRPLVLALFQVDCGGLLLADPRASIVGNAVAI